MHIIRLLPVLLFAGLSSGEAAVIPYTNDFSGTGSNTAFTFALPAADWTVWEDSYRFSTATTSVSASVASIELTNVGNVPFVMETQFTVTSLGTPNANGITLGFGAFGDSSGFSGSGVNSAYYLADWQVANVSSPGTLRILALGDTSGFTSISTVVDADLGSPTQAITLGTTYTLRLEGVYVGTTLNLTLGVYDESGETQIGTSATASDTSPLTGPNFGYRNRSGIGGGTLTVNYDNFSVVPEPGASVLFALGGTLVMALRRRTR
jgi:hypothetical protein